MFSSAPTRLHEAPFGLTDGIVDLLGGEFAEKEFTTYRKAWEELVSRRVYAWQGISDDRVAASMHHYLEVQKDVEVGDAIAAVHPLWSALFWKLYLRCMMCCR